MASMSMFCLAAYHIIPSYLAEYCLSNLANKLHIRLSLQATHRNALLPAFACHIIVSLIVPPRSRRVECLYMLSATSLSRIQYFEHLFNRTGLLQ